MENNNAKKGIDWSMQREAECSNYELVQSNYHNENILNCNFDRIDKKNVFNQSSVEKIFVESL